MIAAGIAALVLVSVLLAFHGWPTNASTGRVTRLIAATTTTQAHVPTLVIGRRATARTAPGRGGATAHRSPIARVHNAPSRGPLYGDASKPKTSGSSPGKKGGKQPCSGIDCGTPISISPQIDQIIAPVTKNASSLTQQLNDGVSRTTKTVGGVVNDVTKVLGGH
jgi:hypothetical protein